MADLAPARAAALDLASERRRRGARARDLLRGSPRMDALDERTVRWPLVSSWGPSPHKASSTV